MSFMPFKYNDKLVKKIIDTNEYIIERKINGIEIESLSQGIMRIISSNKNYKEILEDMLSKGNFKIIIYFIKRYHDKDMLNENYKKIRETYIKATQELKCTKYIDYVKEMESRDLKSL